MIRRLTGSGRELDDFLTIVSEDLEELSRQVAEIGEEVRKRKISPAELRRFDGPVLAENQMVVQPWEVEEAYNQVDEAFIETLNVAIDNIEDFHCKRSKPGWMEPDEYGNILGQDHRP